MTQHPIQGTTPAQPAPTLSHDTAKKEAPAAPVVFRDLASI